jgi:hydrogenase-4 component F
MIASVGIALALLGSLFLAYSAHLGGGGPSLLFGSLLESAAGFSRPWLRSAFVLLLVGYGTKMGLAPLHTWKPDVYGEAPGMVGALLAGGLTSCAFLALLRVYRIVNAAGEGDFARRLLVALGLLSMAVAAVLMVRQRDLKRMLAYSSVEHMGILVLGAGLGGAGLQGSVLHMVNNGLTKSVLFLAAGNIHRAFRSKSLDDVSGALVRLPLSGGLFLAGFFAITGSPPFAPFVSMFAILNAAVASGRWIVASLYVGLLAAVFLGMGATVLAVVQGRPSREALETPYTDNIRKTGPILLSMALVLLLGLWIPEPLRKLLAGAAAGFEVAP